MTRVIILAAGQGKRMLPLTKTQPKCLLPFHGSTILNRLLNQLNCFGINDITIVIGYQGDQIIEAVKNSKLHVTFIRNYKYKEDTNIFSLALALKRDCSPFYLFEADCIFENACFELIFDNKFKNKSVWFTHGFFQNGQNGGIIKSNQLKEVEDIRIVDKYEEKYKSYKKTIGVFKVSSNEIVKYSRYLFEASDGTIRQYFHIPWIRHIGELKSYECDFGNLKVASMNTPKDYYSVLETFRYEIS